MSNRKSFSRYVRLLNRGPARGSRKPTERRTQQDSTPKVVAQTVKFGHPDWVLQSGRHTGVKIGDLPMDFLDWAASKMGWDWAREEIARRYSSVPSPSKKSSSESKAAFKKQRKKEHADTQRKQAHDKLMAMREGVDTVGCDYHRLSTEFDRADGDRGDCPFNTNDYAYTGPSISWVGGQPVIVPSEFPKEAS